MEPETASLMLLKAVGVSPEQFQALTQPFGLRLPNTDDEFIQLTHHLRRMGHIVERSQLNIASTLNRQTQQHHWANENAYPSVENPPAPEGMPEDHTGWGEGSTDWAFATGVAEEEASWTGSATRKVSLLTPKISVVCPTSKQMNTSLDDTKTPSGDGDVSQESQSVAYGQCFVAP